MKPKIAYIGAGTNVGSNLLLNLDKVFHRLQEDKLVRILNTSNAFQSRATVLDRLSPSSPDYVNAVFKVETQLSPFSLLDYLKSVESSFGRDLNSARHSPRIMDLDILLFDYLRMSSPTLTIPHVSMRNRDFVLVPLRQICPESFHDITSLPTATSAVIGSLASYGPHLSWLVGSACHTLAIVNATPDSFSDGGKWFGNPEKRIIDMMSLHHHVAALDIGGESTRPHAAAVPMDEEISRIVPTIELCLRYCKALSIDTTKPGVAKVALDKGCTVVNDVSAESSEDMLSLVASHVGTTIVLMHSRGNSSTMDGLVQQSGDDIVSQVANELRPRIERAVERGIPRWRIMVDPGLGFAKSHKQSFQLLGAANELRTQLGGYMPVMIGHSRKRFLKTEILGLKDAHEDWPSEEVREQVNATATDLARQGGADMVRIHV